MRECCGSPPDTKEEVLVPPLTPSSIGTGAGKRLIWSQPTKKERFEPKPAPSFVGYSHRKKIKYGIYPQSMRMSRHG